jgi:hypothetical protein
MVRGVGQGQFHVTGAWSEAEPIPEVDTTPSPSSPPESRRRPFTIAVSLAAPAPAGVGTPEREAALSALPYHPTVADVSPRAWAALVRSGAPNRLRKLPRWSSLSSYPPAEPVPKRAERREDGTPAEARGTPGAPAALPVSAPARTEPSDRERAVPRESPPAPLAPPTTVRRAVRPPFRVTYAWVEAPPRSTTEYAPREPPRAPPARELPPAPPPPPPDEPTPRGGPSGDPPPEAAVPVLGRAVEPPAPPEAPGLPSPPEAEPRRVSTSPTPHDELAYAGVLPSFLWTQLEPRTTVPQDREPAAADDAEPAAPTTTEAPASKEKPLPEAGPPAPTPPQPAEAAPAIPEPDRTLVHLMARMWLLRTATAAAGGRAVTSPMSPVEAARPSPPAPTAPLALPLPRLAPPLPPATPVVERVAPRLPESDDGRPVSGLASFLVEVAEAVRPPAPSSSPPGPGGARALLPPRPYHCRHREANGRRTSRDSCSQPRVGR